MSDYERQIEEALARKARESEKNRKAVQTEAGLMKSLRQAFSENSSGEKNPEADKNEIKDLETVLSESSRKKTVELHFCDFSQPTICIFYLFSLFHGSFSTYNLYLCAVKQETYGEISQLKKKESYEGLERKESGCIAQWRRRQLRGCGAAGGARREAGPLVYTDRS